MSDYTPTEEEIEEAWASRYDGENTSAVGEERAGYYAEFRRWLAKHDRQVKAQAWREGVVASGINLDWQLHLSDHNPYTEES